MSYNRIKDIEFDKIIPYIKDNNILDLLYYSCKLYRRYWIKLCICYYKI